MGEPVRVAHVVGKMVGGGVEQVVMNYYRHIDRSRVQFDFLVDADSTLIPREEIESLGGRVFVIPPYQHVVAYQRELVRLFRQERWPIVHSHVNALSVFPLRAAKRAGVAVRIAHSHSTSGRGELARNAVKDVLRPLSNVYPTHRMACSRYAGEWLFGKGANFEVVHNAIDLPHFAFDARARAAARAELGLNDDQLVILHVGRFMEQKNHRFLVDVFEEVARRRSDAALLLAGDGELRTDAERRVDELGLSGRVLFLGQRSDVNRLYSAADAFVLPSLYEGLPVVSVEAQASGLPCILSDAITREVDATGAVRFLPIDDSDPWADALCAITPGDRVEIRDGDFADYDIERAGLRLTGRYLELVGGSPCMTGKPLVSIIIPVYNVADYLEECVRSVFSQTYRNIEVVIVDDGSTDGSGALCDRLALEDGRAVVFHKENGGLADARNYGLARCRGEWVSFVDSDDYVSPVFVEALLNAALSGRCEISAVPFGRPFKDGGPCYLAEELGSAEFPTVMESSCVQRLMLYQKLDTGAPWRLYRRELLGDDPFPKGLYYEDLASVYKIIHRVDAVAVLDCRNLYAYRMRSNSIIRQEYRHIKAESALTISRRLYSDICRWYPDLADAAASRCFSLCRMVFAQIPTGAEATPATKRDRNELWILLRNHRRTVLHDATARKRERLAALFACLGKPAFSAFCSFARRFGLMR